MVCLCWCLEISRESGAGRVNPHPLGQEPHKSLVRESSGWLEYETWSGRVIPHQPCTIRCGVSLCIGGFVSSPMPDPDQVIGIMSYYSPGNDAISPQPQPMRELVAEALEFYDEIEEEDRFPILFMLKEIIPGQPRSSDAEYLVRAVAPMLGNLHPVEMIRHAAKALRKAGEPIPDAAFVLVDSWTYPQDVLDLFKGEDGRGKIQSAWGLLPPSQHPRRVNVSVAQIVYKDGFHATAIQTRGDESSRKWIDENEGDFAGGRVPEAMMELVRES